MIYDPREYPEWVQREVAEREAEARATRRTAIAIALIYAAAIVGGTCALWLIARG